MRTIICVSVAALVGGLLGGFFGAKGIFLGAVFGFGWGWYSNELFDYLNLPK